MSIDYSGVHFVAFTQHELPENPVKAVNPSPSPVGGVGTELLNSKIMRVVKWLIGPCKCKEKAAEWDSHGIEWCEANIDLEIIPHLRSMSARFRLLWSEEVARRIVRGAILRARRKARENPA